MSTSTVPQVRSTGKSTDRPTLRLVPTPPARPPFYPTPNSLGPYLSVLRNSAVKLYNYLKWHANRRTAHEYCDRGYDTIARDLVLSRRMVIYAERELERYGLLTRHPWQGRYQGTRANRYTFPTPTGQPEARPPRTRRTRPPAVALAADQGAATSATHCTSLPLAFGHLQVQRIARLQVQRIAPIQDYKHKNVVQAGGVRSNLGAGEAPPTSDISTIEMPTETPIATPSLSDAPDERIHMAWQPTPALEAEARRRGYYAVLGAHGVEESTTAYRDRYDGQVLRPTHWLWWVGGDARQHADWPRYRAQQRTAAAAPLPVEEPFARHTAEEIAEVRELLQRQLKPGLQRRS
jgi:hypothetical protein